jgi:Mrp family chromosome partitioning ATPase
VCDGVIVVVRPDYTSRPACKRALESVPKEKLLGVVLNCVTEWFLDKRLGYGYSYEAYQTRQG